jgi:hypothetical protein
VIDWTTETAKLCRQAETAMIYAEGLASQDDPRGVVYAINGLTSAVLLVAAEIREAAETGVRLVND